MLRFAWLAWFTCAGVLATATPTPEGGVLIVPPHAIATMRSPSASSCGTLMRVPVEGQPFPEALRCEVAARPDPPWAIQFQFRTTRNVQKGEVLWARFYARTLSAKNETGGGRVGVIFEKAGPPYDKALSFDLGLGREWNEYFLPFKSISAYEAGQASAGFHLGTQIQTVEIADFEVYSFGPTYDMAKLPRTRIVYEDQAPDAPWRTAAAARIEQLRKGDLTVVIADSAGRPVPGARITVSMRRHAFAWGSAVTAKDLLRQDADGDRYRAVVEKTFTRVVFENDLKWPVWDTPANRANTLRAADWLRTRNIEIRGHNLIWPSWLNMPRDVITLKDNPEALRRRITAHIADEVDAWKGRLADWDVINEPYSNHDVMDLLGKDEMAAWFKLARQHDPNVRLTLNDYAILSACGTDGHHQDHFEQTLRFLKERGAPITGLGLQSHFDGTPTPPERMLAILDRFAALGLDISITEHDIDTTDEQLQADFTRDFLTAVFSHPSVTAVLTWGFWEKSHWRPNAAYYRNDWSLRPAGQVWLDLVTRQWWTHASLTTDAKGTAHARGFLGDYTVTVTHSGASKEVPVTLTRPGATISISL